MGGVDWVSILSLIGTTLNYLSLIVQKKNSTGPAFKYNTFKSIMVSKSCGELPLWWAKRKQQEKSSSFQTSSSAHFPFPLIYWDYDFIYDMMLQRYDVTKVWCYKGMMLQRYDATKVWCYKGMMLQRYDVTKVWCYKGMMLQRYDVTKVWCYKSMMLQKYDATKVWCYKSMMLQRYDVTKVWCYKSMILYTIWCYKSMMLQRLLPLLQAGPSYFGWQSHLNFQYTLGSSSHWALSLLHNVSLSQGEGNPK